MANNFSNIETLRYYVQKVLPLVYDDSISYYELLGKITAKLNDLIQNNNNIPDYLSELIKEYINSDELKETLQDIMSNWMLNVKYPPKGINPAMGDGTTDDGESIQGCIDWASTNGYGFVYFPSGQYLTHSLALKNNVSLGGLDRYSTSLVMIGGVQNPLLTGNDIENVGIYNLKLDGNSGIQVNDVDLVHITGENVYLQSLILEDAHRELYYNGTGGHLQIDNVIVGNTVSNSFTIVGNSVVQMSNVIFNQLSIIGGQNVIEIGSNNGSYNFISKATCSECCHVIGDNNKIVCQIDNATTPINDGGKNNNIEVVGKYKKSTVSGSVTNSADSVTNTVSGSVTNSADSVTNTISGSVTNSADSVTNTVSGSVTNSADSVTNTVSGSVTNSANKYTIESNTEIKGNQLYINTNKPLKYGSIIKAQPFNLLPMTDNNNNNYNLLVDNIDTQIELKTDIKSNDLSIEYLSTFWRDYAYTSDTKITPIQQGCAIIDDEIAIMCCVNSDDTLARLYKVNYITGEIINSNTFTDYTHCNSATYIGNNTMLIALTGIKGVAVINTETLTETQRILTDYTFTGIAYDRVLDIIYARNGDTYYKIDKNYNILSSKQHLTSEKILKRINNNDSYRQGLIASNGMVACLYWSPNYFTLFDYETNVDIRTYSFPKCANNGSILQELEDGDFISNSEIILAFNSPLATNFKGGTKFYKLDLVKNTLSGDNFTSAWASPFMDKYIYCDASTTNNTPDGSKTYPFRYIQDAIQTASCKTNLPINITLLTSGNYGPIHCTGLSSPFRITGNGNSILSYLIIERCTNVDIRNCIITPDNINTLSPVYINQAKVTFNNCIFNPPSTITKYYLQLTTANVFIYNGSTTVKDEFETNFSLIERNSNIKLLGFDYSSVDDSKKIFYLTGTSTITTRPTTPISATFSNSFGNPSIVKISEEQDITINTNLTLINTDAIPFGLAHQTNLLIITFASGTKYFTFTSLIQPTTQTLRYSYTFIENSITYFNDFALLINSDTNNYIITPKVLHCYTQNLFATEYNTATNLNSSSANYPKIHEIYVGRI